MFWELEKLTFSIAGIFSSSVWTGKDQVRSFERKIFGKSGRQIASDAKFSS